MMRQNIYEIKLNCDYCTLHEKTYSMLSTLIKAISTNSIT